MTISDSFCAYPWFNLNTTPQGSCKLCCNIVDSDLIMKDSSGRSIRSIENNLPVDWGRDAIDDIWNGEHMQQVRRTMLLGDSLPECADCHRLESIGLPSPRSEANDRYWEWLPDELSTKAALPTSLELRLSTRCNLACVTCWSGSSDMVRLEQMEQLARSELPMDHADHLSIPPWLEGTWRSEISSSDILLHGGRYASSEISLANFSKLAPSLRRLYITGGEPTMDSNVSDYLRLLIEHGNTDCHVSFTTNGTLWTDQLMSLLANFPNAEVQISIDGHEDANDWIRHHSDWLDIIGNVDRYFAMPNLNKLVFYTVVSAVNSLSLDPLIRYLRHTTHRHQKMAIWTPIILQHPVHLRPTVIPKDARAKAANSLEETFNAADWPEHPFYYREGLGRVLTVLRDDNGDDGLGVLEEYMDHTQSVRLAMLRSFAKSHKINVDDLEAHGFIRPRLWPQVFPGLAKIMGR